MKNPGAAVQLTLMQTLAKIYEGCSRDVHRFGSDKETRHSYIETYEQLFSPYRDKAELIFEIGLQAGWSLMMWHRYFPNAVVHGIDIKDAIAKEVRHCPQIHAHKLNAENYAVIDDMFENDSIDIAIDDGSHTICHQVLAACTLLPKVKPGGLLIIEDVCHIDSWLLYRELNATLEVIDLSDQRPEVEDNVLFVLRK